MSRDESLSEPCFRVVDAARELGIDYSITGPLFKGNVGGDWLVKQGMIIQQRRKRIDDSINMWEEYSSVALCSNMLVQDVEGSVYVILMVLKNGITMMNFVFCYRTKMWLS